VTDRSILVYHPEPGDAQGYARRIKQPRPVFTVTACSTQAEAELHVADAEILYAWNFPPHLLLRAKRLRWVQNMGAGVERFLIPELPKGVALTRIAGIFGPWMAEYVLGWCLWHTQRTELFRAQQRESRWRQVDPLRLHGAELCIVGLGDIGRTIARAARGVGDGGPGGRASAHPPRADRSLGAADATSEGATAGDVVAARPAGAAVAEPGSEQAHDGPDTADPDRDLDAVTPGQSSSKQHAATRHTRRASRARSRYVSGSTGPARDRSPYCPRPCEPEGLDLTGDARAPRTPGRRRCAEPSYRRQPTRFVSRTRSS